MAEPEALRGVILGLPELIGIAGVLFLAMGALSKVIYALWQDNKQLSALTLTLAKEAMPLLALQGKILEDHNQLDVARALQADQIAKLVETLQDVVNAVSSMQARCSLMLKLFDRAGGGGHEAGG